MAAVSVWGISAVRPGASGSRFSSPPVSSRGATGERPWPSSPRLSRSGARFAASRGRRAAAGPAAACAASRCSAPGLGLGRRGRPLAPGRRPAPPAPRQRAARRPGSRGPNAPAARPPASLPGPAPGSRRVGGRRAAQAAGPRAGLCRRARSPSGARPPPRLHLRPAVRRPKPAAAPFARAPGRSLSGSGRVRGDPSGAEAASGGDRLAGVVVRRRQHVWCCVCRAVSPCAGRGGGGLPVNLRPGWPGAAGPVRLLGQPARRKRRL